jgi:predicted alpha/beta-fold hydrolase
MDFVPPAFHPMFGCSNGIIQTILQDIMPIPFPSNKYIPEKITFPDGVATFLDWKEPPQAPDHAPIIVCLHGLGGNSSSRYLRIFTNYASQLGYRSVVYNRRGHGTGSLMPQSGSFKTCAHARGTLREHNSETTTADCKIFPRHVNMDDMEYVVDHIQKKYPNAPKYLVGFSCGGNLAINYLAHHQTNPFLLTVAICNGYDIYNGTRLLKSKYFQKRATDFLLDLLDHRRFHEARNLAAFKNVRIDWMAALQAKTIQDFETAVVVPAYGLQSLKEYYDQDSSHNKLDRVKSPLLCISNDTDPFVPKEMNKFPELGSKTNPYITHINTKYGGHLGWIEGLYKMPWYMNVIFGALACAHASAPAPSRGTLREQTF